MEWLSSAMPTWILIISSILKTEYTRCLTRVHAILIHGEQLPHGLGEQADAAPRALYVACASDDLWGDPRGSYLALYHSLPVFQLTGTGSKIPEYMPPLNRQVLSGKVGFHIRDRGHNMLISDWNWFIDFADATIK